MKDLDIKKTTNKQAKQKLREKLLKIRNSFSKTQQIFNAECILTKLMTYPPICSGQHIAIYCSANGEVDTTIMLKKLQQMKKKCYVPVILSTKNREILFVPWDEAREMQANRYGINEPVCGFDEYICPWHLDVVLVPLVAFDLMGNRLGMGGGFYDKSFLNRDKWHPAPLLIGIAHDFQCIAEGVPTDSWDIRLDAVFTEKNIYTFI
ncbi:MAG: 5-formyltetrahydrofolate cyclo-ligase [Endozoicomonadaceae bacterium]|nr:5-formyltetrahydrofolate cyclo-ligase [Endozoicomonadaceae bacterium]